MERLVHRVQVKGFRVELPAKPVDGLLILLVVRIPDHLQQVLVSPEAAAVLRRTRPLARETDGILNAFFRREETLYFNGMNPAIAEVVLVEEFAPSSGNT